LISSALSHAWLILEPISRYIENYRLSDMRRMISSFLVFAISLLVLLPITYVIIISLFHQEVVINQAKVLEEASKVFASFLLAITSLGLSQIGERLKIQRKGEALKSLIKSKLYAVEAVIDSLSAMVPPHVEQSAIEDLRINKEFYRDIKTRVDSLIMTLTEAQQLLMRSEPEAIGLCQELLETLSQVTKSGLLYSQNPTRQNLEEFKDSLPELQRLAIRD
jgi:hypothetical protein